ncbi:MAG TPA: NCS2 family permease [Fimbriimonas sp.]
MLERLFRLTELGTTVRTEVLGGITTFVTMAYIIVVNPAILSFAGFPIGPTTLATILVAIAGCFAMGLYANRPFAVAPYMGENAFLAFGLTALGISWQLRLGAVFLAGLLFLILTLLNIRQWLASAISPSLKHAFAVGIVTSGAAGADPKALTLATGFLRAPDVPVKLGDFHDPKVMLAILGFLIIVSLMRLGIKGSILIGIAAVGLLGGLLGYAKAPEKIVEMPFRGDITLEPILGKLDVAGALHLSLLPVVLTLMVMAFLDTTGTLVGLGSAANLLDENGDLPDLQKPMLVDAASCMFAAVIGTSTTGAYVESAAGIKDGARTGLSTVVVGLLFAVSLFFIPLITPLQSLTFAYGPALVVVGVLMLPAIKHVDFEDLTESVPAFLAIVLTVFSYNIANGLSAALAVYPLLKLSTGRAREVKLGSWILGALCLAYYVLGVGH